MNPNWLCLLGALPHGAREGRINNKKEQDDLNDPVVEVVFFPPFGRTEQIKKDIFVFLFDKSQLGYIFIEKSKRMLLKEALLCIKRLFDISASRH